MLCALRRPESWRIVERMQRHQWLPQITELLKAVADTLWALATLLGAIHLFVR